MAEANVPTVVLVHGGFADGSGWRGVYDLLKDGFSARLVGGAPDVRFERAVQH